MKIGWKGFLPPFFFYHLQLSLPKKATSDLAAHWTESGRSMPSPAEAGPLQNHQGRLHAGAGEPPAHERSWPSPARPSRATLPSHLNKLEIREGSHWVVRDVDLEECRVELIVAAPQRRRYRINSVAAAERVRVIQATRARRWLVFTWKRRKKKTQPPFKWGQMSLKVSSLFSK